MHARERLAPPLSWNFGIGIEKRDWGTRFRGRYFKGKTKKQKQIG
jgi:hypothetical protein